MGIEPNKKKAKAYIAFTARLAKYDSEARQCLSIYFPTALTDRLEVDGVVAFDVKARAGLLASLVGRSADTIATRKLQFKRGGRSAVELRRASFREIFDELLPDAETRMTDTLVHYYPASRTLQIFEPTSTGPVDR